MVIKYFMHLDVEKRIVHYFLATALVFMFLFFAAVAPDVMKHSGTQWENVSAQETVQKGMAEGSGHESTVPRRMARRRQASTPAEATEREIPWGPSCREVN